MRKMDTWVRLAGALFCSLCLTCLEPPTVPELAGPSTLAVSLEITITPDELIADGVSSAEVKVVYRGENGQVVANKTIHFDLGVRTDNTGGVVFGDFGALGPINGSRPSWGGPEGQAVSAKTNSNGIAKARYWSPFRTDQANDLIVTITARPAGDDFGAARLRQADIKLRAANRSMFPEDNACAISVEPAKTWYSKDEILNFTATQLNGNTSDGCAGNAIARYQWDFGDGDSAVGRTVSHVFSDGCGTEGCPVTLWTTESVTGCQGTCSINISTDASNPSDPSPSPGPGPAPGPGPGPDPEPTRHSFTSADVPKGTNDGTGCPNGFPCIISTVDTSGVTGTIDFMRVGFHGSFPDASETGVHLYGPGYPGEDERAAFAADGVVGAGWGANCTINPRGSFTGPGATTWDDEAPEFVAGGTTPYDASYKGNRSPGLSSLASDLNANPSDINGTFTLVIDRWTAGGITTETLDCWTLEIWTVP